MVQEGSKGEWGSWRRENIGKQPGRSLDTGRRNKTRKLDTRLSLSLSFLPLYSTEANHPIRFSSFHLYIDFLPSRPFFFSLGKACANFPMRAFYLSRANRTPSRIFPIVWLYPTLYSIIHRPVNFPLWERSRLRIDSDCTFAERYKTR